MHVPLIVNWTGRIPAGKVNDDLVGSVDFLPTLCEAAGVELPQSLSIDGQSFLQQAMGQSGAPRQWLYTWYSSNGSEAGKAEFARTKTHKLYRAGDQAEITKELRAVLEQHADARPPELKKQLPDEQSRKSRRARQRNRQKRRSRQSAEQPPSASPKD
jgi:arylsulfatase A